jgi:chemotaxis protein MotB
MAAVAVLLYSCGPSKKLKAANAQIEQLTATNKMLSQNLDDAKKQNASLTANNSSLSNQLSSCQQDAHATAQRLEIAHHVLQEQRDKMKQLQEKLDAGLTDFETRGVSVYTKDGIVYVSMEDKLLYKSGSAKMSDSGKTALAHLATVLNDYPNLKIIVLGNTDDVKFKNGTDNWSLSTERANGAVRVLRDAGVDPMRLTAAGKGKYNPIADNTTAEGRAKNRRTDIILNPDFAGVLDSLDK